MEIIKMIKCFSVQSKTPMREDQYKRTGLGTGTSVNAF
jgi:hypothetical protein